MINMKQSLRECALGFFLGVVLLSVASTAAFAQTNTAYGTGALPGNTGSYNSAFGFDALFSNTTGFSNTASGYQALLSNTTGYNNTASGVDALLFNTTGVENTAAGDAALVNNTTGFDNTAIGFQSLFSNTGYYNTANGSDALLYNTTGSSNTASGAAALVNNTTGNNNTASGDAALVNNTIGNSNIGLGYQAGYNVTTGSNNIEIGSQGASVDDSTIRIGTQGTQRATYIAGIYGTPMTGGQAVNMVVSGSGQLGVRPSSARYKRDIQPLDERSQGLWQLHPVTFRYKQDPSNERQYGLIAEQVAEVYPELVVRGEKGEVESVQYEELIPLMLNEMQHQRDEVQHQQAALNTLKAQNAALQARLERLEHARTKTLASR
jgi:hypothetical protein